MLCAVPLQVLHIGGMFFKRGVEFCFRKKANQYFTLFMLIEHYLHLLKPMPDPDATIAYPYFYCRGNFFLESELVSAACLCSP
jgi:hypothetical protein